MTAIHWLTDINGSFTNASDWSGGAVPGPSDDAILDAVGNTPYTVTASANVSVSSIQLASEATLSITGGTFAAAQGTGSGANAGIILVAPQATLTAGGQIANSGSIQIGNASAGGSLLLSDYVTFSGRGQIELGASGHSHIDGNPYGVLVNLDNTISGSGTLGSGRGEFNLLNESAGVIDADATKPLVVYNLTNHGLAEATGQGGLTIKHSLFPPGYNGTFDVENDSTMQFYYSGIQGTLVSDGSGIFWDREMYLLISPYKATC